MFVGSVSGLNGVHFLDSSALTGAPKIFESKIDHNCKRWITRFVSRGRTQLAAINGVNCRTRRALDILTLIAPSGQSRGNIYLRVGKQNHSIHVVRDLLVEVSSGNFALMLGDSPWWRQKFPKPGAVKPQ